ncbi:MAG: Fe-S cluster assembly sulfur transfer protein SufU [Lentisphaeria bacterium]
MYQDTLLDHHRKPRHFGELGGTPTVERENPLCGDVVRLAIDLTDNAICDLRFDGHGCALCIASASLMCCALRDKDTDAARALAANLMSALTAKETPELAGLGELACLTTVRDFPMRLKCVTLPWTAVDELLKK